MESKPQRPANVGDTFAVPLDDGRFCAVRVIRVCEEEGTSLVAITPWLGDRPGPDEPLLREVLREHRGRYRGTPAIRWYAGQVPSEFVHVGVIPPSHEEQVHDARGAYAGRWSRVMVRPAILELEGLAQCNAVCPLKVGSESEVDRLQGVMSEAQFWRIVDRLDWKAKDNEGIIEPAVTYLASLSVERIAGFHGKLCEKLFELDREDLAREIGEASYGSNRFSPDHFLDVRCAVVASGRAFFEEVRSRPENMPKDREFEALLRVAESAHRRKTGRKASFAAQHDCATFSNALGWKQM